MQILLTAKLGVLVFDGSRLHVVGRERIDEKKVTRRETFTKQTRRAEIFEKQRS